MKFTALLLSVLTITAAEAKIDKKCVTNAQEVFGLAVANRICDSKNYVKPNELGWSCLLDGGTPKFSKDVKGGARLKRDAVCD